MTGANADEHHAVCSATGAALHLLDRCAITPQRAPQIHVTDEVRHPLGGGLLFGRFDTRQERVLVSPLSKVLALVRGTPYEELPSMEFYKSLIVHELVHAIMHQNLKRPASTNAAYEYPAYALQIESLAPPVRETFLRAFDRSALAADFLFNDPLLLFDPYLFAARAYEHFKKAHDGCALIRALLQGEVPFIVSLPPGL